MNDWFVTFFSMSVAGTFLILILVLARPFYHKKLSKKWQYYVWLIVAARLLLPVASETSLVGNWFTNVDTKIIQPISRAYLGEETRDMGPDSLEVSSVRVSDSNEKIPLFNIGAVWLIVVLVLLIRKITIYQSFAKYVRAGCRKVEDITLLEQMGIMIEEQKIKAGIELYTNSLISSPLILGLWKPCIILPTDSLSSLDFKYTILHELTHYKRIDIGYKWLIQIVICLHWFNPFVYLVEKEINRLCELSCDEKVISTLDELEKRNYGETLLNSIRESGRYKNGVASVTLCESKKLLKERLGAIMVYKKQSGIVRGLSVILLFFDCLWSNLCGSVSDT